MRTSLCDLPALDQLRLIKSREISAAELLEAHLARIDAVEGRQPSTEAYAPDPEDLKYVHAFITVTRERAQAQAKAVDEALAKGQDPGPLAGLPLAVKDIFCVRGTRSTAGSRILERFVSPYTATPVARMEAAGAVMIGKVNMDEFAFGSSSESSAFLPPPGNPWNPAYVPGGSSGGSTAAVAGPPPLRRAGGLKFRRQHPFGPYIADFYCAALQLVIEVDGRTHIGRAEADERRTRYLEKRGLRVLRFTNDDVIRDVDGVVATIGRLAGIERTGDTDSPSPCPLPARERGERVGPESAGQGGPKCWS